MKASLYELAPAAALLLLSVGLAGCPQTCEDEGETYDDGDTWSNSDGDDCECIEGSVDCVDVPDPCVHEGDDHPDGDSWTDSAGDACTCDDGTVDCVAPTLLRGVHLVPDIAPPCDLDGDTATTTDIGAACLDLYVEDSTVPLNLESGPFPFGASTAHVALPLTGTLTFHAVAYGETNIAANRLESVAVTLAAGDTKTFVLYGLDSVEVSTDVSNSDVSAPPTGKARVRIFQAELPRFGATPIDVWVGFGVTKIADNLAYGTYSTAMDFDPISDVPVGIDVNNDGTPEWATAASVATTGIYLAANTVHDLFLVLNPTFVDTTPMDGVDDNVATNPPVLILQYVDDANEPTKLGIFPVPPS